MAPLIAHGDNLAFKQMFATSVLKGTNGDSY